MIQMMQLASLLEALQCLARQMRKQLRDCYAPLAGWMGKNIEEGSLDDSLAGCTVP